MAKKINKEFYWLGINNPNGREFHGISTTRGGSYNSYLVIDEMPTIIDGTNSKFFDEYKESIISIIDPLKIKYMIVNHAEHDHAGAIIDIMNLCSNAKIVCTKKCQEILINAFDVKSDFLIIEENYELSIGKRTFIFHPQPMIHWPETMLSYLKEDKILFSGDLYGTEISHDGKFADEMEPFQELTRDYFAIVMRPLDNAVKEAVRRTREFDIDILAPSHGPLYRNNFKIIDYYEKLANNPEENKVTIIYASTWHTVENIAKKIKEKLELKGTKVNIFDINKSNLVNIMGDALTSKIIIAGSNTLNGTYHPLFNAIGTFFKWNQQKSKNCFIFGSYGWSANSTRQLKTKFEELDYIVHDTLDYNFGIKTQEDKQKLESFINKISSITG